ncbi:HNH endonuclease signature motif containing protein [Nocardia sp. CC216A]|uniref:HNH endonuclease signature motif containing protein n=1 Tax=Nocardia sp. CC216A TaxID=3044158 RepID=UPI0027962489|nr:HNH endonuclease signature motif containing protein [Nocardia sp. CC216A]
MIPEGGTRGGDTAAGLSAAMDALLATDLTGLSDTALVGVMREVESVRCRVAALSHRMIAEVESRHLWERAGAKGMRGYLIDVLRLSAAEAGARVRASASLRPRAFCGEPGPALLPTTAALQAEGVVSPEHARVIMRVMDRIPNAVPVETQAEAEQQLARAAVQMPPEYVSKVGHVLLSCLDPDGVLTNDDDRARRRELWVGKQRVDGMSEIKGVLDPQLRALLDVVLAKWARPGMCNPEDPDSPRMGPGAVDKDLMEVAARRDRRSAGQRNHDAVKAFLAAAGGPENLGSHRGVPVSVVLTMSLTDLQAGAGYAHTASGSVMSIPDALRMAEGSYPLLMLFDGKGLPLHLGRGRYRLASPWQRLACIAADRGCTRPGCEAPATMCAVHHMVPWLRGGRTDIENLTLVCDRCHAQIPEDVEDPTGWATLGRGNSNSSSSGSIGGNSIGSVGGNGGNGLGSGGNRGGGVGSIGNGLGSGGNRGGGVGSIGNGLGSGGNRGGGVGSGRYPGRVVWAPPTRIDPARVPRVNLHHHPEQWLTDAPGGQSPPTLSQSTSPTLGQPMSAALARSTLPTVGQSKPSVVGRPIPPPLGRQGAGACDRPSPRQIDRNATDHHDRSDHHARTVPPHHAQRPDPTRGDHLRQ